MVYFSHNLLYAISQLSANRRDFILAIFRTSTSITISIALQEFRQVYFG